MIVKSANDAAVTLAAAVGGSEQAFVTLMNRRAAAARAHPHALRELARQGPGPATTRPRATSPRSAATLMRDARLPRPRRHQDAVITWPPSHPVTVTSHNRLLDYPWGDGIKTGATAKAGRSSSARASRRSAAHRRDHARADARPGGEGRGRALQVGRRASRPGAPPGGLRAAPLRARRRRSRCVARPPAVLLPSSPAAAARAPRSPADPSVPAPAPQPPEVKARTGILIERASGTVLWSKDADRELPPASCTKIMTALLTLEHVDDLDAYATVPDIPLPQTVGVDLRPGDRITVREALYALMVKSANDAALTLATYVGGKREDVHQAHERARRAARTHAHALHELPGHAGGRPLLLAPATSRRSGGSPCGTRPSGSSCAPRRR